MKNSKPKFWNLTKAAIVLFGLIFLFTLSEVLFQLNQNPKVYGFYFLKRAQLAANGSDPPNSLEFLIKGANKNIQRVEKTYADLIPSNYTPTVNISQTSIEFKKVYSSYIESLDLTHIVSSEEIDFSRIFYNLGVLAYRYNQPELIIPFFQTAVYLNPELSHMHVELANYYLYTGEKKEAEKALDFCLKFKYPVQHCQDYRDSNLLKNTPEVPGFLEKELENYYQSKLNR